MVYRSGQFSANSAIAARERFEHLLSVGQRERTAIAQKAEESRRRAVAAAQKQEAKRMRDEASAAKEGEVKRRREAVSRLGWWADWWIAILLSLALFVGWLAFLPMFIVALGFGWEIIGLIAAVAAVPFLIPVFPKIMIRRYLAKERARLEASAIPIEGHWEALGARLRNPVIEVEFKGKAPRPEIVANVVMALASSAKTKRTKQALLTSRRVEVERQTLRITNHAEESNRRYRQWFNGVAEHLVPELASVYPVRAIRVLARNE